MGNRPTARGRYAEHPTEIPLSGWKDIGKRVVDEFSDDRVLLISAGATFYLLLALFPALTAFVSLYGVVSDPKTIADHVAVLGGILPSGGVEVIEEQLNNLVQQGDTELSLGFVFGLCVALWSSNSGIKTIFKAMNVAYDEPEKRGFIKLNMTTLAFTLAALAIGILMIVSVGVVPAILEFAGLAEYLEWTILLLRWPVFFIGCWLGISVIYRYGPSRSLPDWRWVLLGSFLATAIWLAASILFSWYLQNFADYNKTYGSLGAVMGFMMWCWISVTILVMGAELNAEIEHQTKIDSTIGPDEPMGRRGAVMADTLGKTFERHRSVSGRE